MDFKNYSSVGRSQADENFIAHGGELYGNYLVNDEKPQYNDESGEGIRLQQTTSGKTYFEKPKTNLKNTRIFTQNSNAFFDDYQDDMTRHNIPNFNFNAAVSQSYEFNNVSCSSKQQNIRNEYRNKEFKSAGVKTFCAGNTYPTEENHQSKYSEKSTYCRAFFNNQEFVYRTMAKNAKLQRLIKKLLLLRQKQKDEDLWNNYINELKNKHGYTMETGGTRLENLEEIPAGRIEDYYDSNQMHPCQNLIKDFYSVHNIFNRNVHFKTKHYPYQPRQQYYQPYVFENQPLCYPTSSQGRLMMLNKERQDNMFLKDYLQHRNHRGNLIFVDREHNRPNRNQTFRKLQPTKSSNTLDSQSPSMVRSSTNSKSIQTDFRCLFPISDDRKDDVKVNSTKERYKQVAKNVEILKRKLETSNTDVKQNALDNIESKLNNLIQTLNTFMVDIRANNPFNRDDRDISVSMSDRIRDNSLNDLNAAISDRFDIVKREEAVCRVAHENSNTTSGFLDTGPSTRCTKDKYMKIDKILNEELDKSNKVKRDIEDIMYHRTHRPRAVQITFDIPTRERSTEVTDSLSTAKVNDNSIEEEIGNSVNTSVDRRMTIAVNTDPLGLLGLLRISSEAVKQILSYMPHIDYYSYLSMLQFPQARNGVTHYICNICGASFERPSQLSDHIQTHNLGYSRDCCVCRHVLDTKRHRPGLFKCKYCGQRFTRAYCCELHEETCAKRLGVRHDVSSSLNLLQ